MKTIHTRLLAGGQIIVAIFSFSHLGTVLAQEQKPHEVNHLIQELQSEDDSASYQAGRDLARLKDPSSVEPLIKSLAHKKGIVRSRAALALGTIGDKRAVDALLATLKDEDKCVRFGCASAIGQIKDTRTIEALIGCLKDEFTLVRWEAAKGLGNIGKPCVSPLLKALQDKNPSVRKWAAFALGEIKETEAVKALEMALKKKDLEVIAGAYQFFIRKGQPGTESVLLGAFNKYGGMEMAFAFILSENEQLSTVGAEWQRENTKGSESISGPTETDLTWGCGK